MVTVDVGVYSRKDFSPPQKKKIIRSLDTRSEKLLNDRPEKGTPPPPRSEVLGLLSGIYFEVFHVILSAQKKYFDPRKINVFA